MWLQKSPWRPIDGSGQAIAYTLAGTAASAPVGAHTYAVRLSCITGNCMVRINNGKVATAALDVLLKTTDPAIELKIAPGQVVEVYGIAAGTLYMCELTY